MKRAFLFFLVFILSAFLSAQTFDKTYNIHSTYFQQSIPLDDAFVISAAAGWGNISLLKTDKLGNQVWEKTYIFSHSTPTEFCNIITETNDGGFAVIRSYFNSDNAMSYIYLMKISADGDSLWTKTFEYPGRDYQAVSILQVPSNEFILLAESITKFIIFKTNGDGELIWEKPVSTTAVSGEFTANLLALDDSSFLVRREDALFAYNTDGELLWEQELDFKTSYAAATADGNVIISGMDKLLKINHNGDEIWRRNFKGNINFVWGMEDLTSTLIIDYKKIVSVSNYGIVLWEKDLAPDSDDKFILSATETSDHYILLSGRGIYSGGSGLIRMDPDGNYVTVDLLYVSGFKIQDGVPIIDSYNSLYLSWRASVSSINIEYTADGGDTWNIIEENYPADSLTYTWIVPNAPNENCRLRIVDSANQDNYDIDKNIFSIYYYIATDYIAANEILMWNGNNGEGSHSPHTDGSGLFWPEGENATIPASFADGLVFGGKINGEIRVNGNTSRPGLYPGPIFSDGSLAEEKDPSFRIFKLKKNWEQLPEGIERTKYEENYNDWPMAHGAPFEDVNGDGEYTPGVDVPKIIGDETLFYVANGYDSTSSLFTYGSPPMPLEFQTTIWAYSGEGMENVVFKKYRVINKGNDPIEDFYFTYWTDVDLGNPGDDLSGCDSLLNLGYTYNGDDDDEFFYGTNPPAIGYQLVQGPVVEGNETDSAYFNGAWHKGFRNIPMTNFFNFVKGSPLFGDIVQGIYEGTLQFYNIFQTLMRNGDDVLDPYTNKKASFMTPGDPLTDEGWYDGEGWLIGNYHPRPRDVRFSMSSGPFYFAPGDPQEVVYAIHLARGSDRLNSITKLKEQAIAVQQFYNGKILTGVNNDISEIPGRYELYQNYPNPFNPSTVISYQIPQRTRVEIFVFDILGRKVATLIDKEQPAGNYKVEFNGKGLSSGVYFITMRTNKFIKTIKAALLK